MVEDLKASKPIYQPSKFWIHYLKLNVSQLNDSGIENFKQSVNLNYFNWMGYWIEKQRDRVFQNLGLLQAARCKLSCFFDCSPLPKDSKLSEEEWRAYKQCVATFYEFVSAKDELRVIGSIEEPLLGNPYTFRYRGRLISQDICNSVFELNSLTEGRRDVLENARVLEIGGGYGRIADVILKSFPEATVTMVDIPPASMIAEWYLSSIHQDRKVFKYRQFDDFEQVREEFESASVRFLLPHQLELVPDSSFDVCVNVSSFHEMRPDQIQNWFNQVDRLVSGYLYSKQWIRSINEHDDIVVNREEYPVKESWFTVFDRVCEIQEDFFEALYRIP